MPTLNWIVVAALAAIAALPAGLPAGGAQEKPANVAGSWALTVETANGTGTPTLTLQQEGERLTGTYSSQVFGEQKVTGSIKGNSITFAFTAAIEGNNITVTYTGTVDAAAMKGKVTLGDLGEGTFTGKKQ
jgi:hypothetical protein